VVCSALPCFANVIRPFSSLACFFCRFLLFPDACHDSEEKIGLLTQFGGCRLGTVRPDRVTLSPLLGHGCPFCFSPAVVCCFAFCPSIVSAEV
jgi:hypothetical protein